MRALLALSFATLAAIGPFAGTPAALAVSAPAAKAPAAPSARPKPAELLPAYPAAQLAAARAHRAAQRLAEAERAAEQARAAADRQLELHKALSEVALSFELARGERAAAREAGLLRDEATFLLAELARERGETDTAIARFADVVGSQPDTPLGERAYEALKALGFAASPLPASPAPKGS